MLQKWLNSLTQGIDFNTLKTAILSYYNELNKFHFSVSNPLFWLFLFILFLILAWFWGFKKSFSFCCIVAILSLATTKVEEVVREFIVKAGGIFDPLIIRAVSVVILFFILIYYIFIKA